MKTNIQAIKVELADAADIIREIRAQTRRQCDPMRQWGFRQVSRAVAPDGTYATIIEKPVPISRRKTLRAGRNLTPDEGRALASAKRDATLLNTIRAAHRGKVHSATFLRSPALLEELAAAWRSFMVVPAPVPAEAATEIGAEEVKVGA